MKLTNSAFGRRVKVTIYTQDGYSIIFDTSLIENKRSLRISGVVKKYFAFQPPEATVNIYNLSPIEVGNILNLKYKKVGNNYVEQQLRIKIEAGYIYGYFDTIFDGEILKPNMMRPDPNNTQLRLTCLDGANFCAAGGSITQTFNDGINYYSVAEQIRKNSNIDYRLELSPTLANRTVDGSFVCDGTLLSTYEKLAESSGDDVVFSYNDGTAYLQTLEEMINKPQEAFVLNSQTGLMGIPALTNDGITIQSVLNPKIKILSRLKVNNAEISIDQPEYLANRQIGAWLNADGLYLVNEMEHQFDTVNGAFCTNCKCWSNDYYDYIKKE